MHSNRIHRREILDALAGAAVFTPAVAQDVARRANGLPALTIKEDVLPPEQIAWYRNIRQVCSTPQAIGEVFTHPFEVIPLITDRLIDFIRCRVAAMGGITPVRKLAVLCETFAVKTAFQEGGENDPVNQLAAYHIDLSSSAFGIQEENHFPPVIHDMFPGNGRNRKGYLYDSDKAWPGHRHRRTPRRRTSPWADA